MGKQLQKFKPTKLGLIGLRAWSQNVDNPPTWVPKQKVANSKFVARSPFLLVLTELRPAPLDLINGFEYYVIFVDPFTRFTLLEQKKMSFYHSRGVLYYFTILFYNILLIRYFIIQFYTLK